MYRAGRGAPQDYFEATKWYKSAIVARADGACKALAQSSLQMGDYVAAHEWFNLAASAGDESSAKSRDDVANLMTPTQVATAQRLASETDAKSSLYPTCR